MPNRNSPKIFVFGFHLFPNFIEMALGQKIYFNTSDSNTISLLVLRAPTFISQFPVVFVILCITIENEFATARRFENIIKIFNLVDFLYQKYKGMQAYERAERRSVTDTLNFTPE